MSINKKLKDFTADKKFIQEFINRMLEDEERSKAAVSNTDYVLWLEKFTESYPGFVDDQWQYSPNELSKEDSEKVDMLQYFLSGIRYYAYDNYIPMEGEDLYDYHFFFKFNGIGYEIGSVSGQGTYTYCHREEISPDKHFIEFEDIMTNKVQDNVAAIKENLEVLNSVVRGLLALGAPEDRILSCVTKVLDEHADTINED